MVPVRDMGQKEVRQYGHSFRCVLPVIQLHCETESCNGIRFFQPADSENLEPKKLREHFVTFVCRNCGKTKKTYALWSFLSEDEINGELLKFGEHPPFGPPTPARVISLIGPEKEYYLKGRRAENQGLGIAAFAYYRRIVENQKNRILDGIIRVSLKIGASKEILDDLNAAKSESSSAKRSGPSSTGSRRHFWSTDTTL